MKNFKLSSVSGKINAQPTIENDPLDQLIGTWEGKGFNQIWRPVNRNSTNPSPSPNQDRFLELNETIETLVFDEVSKEIANRGLLQQSDINLHGISYLQRIQDANVKDENGKLTGIHFEPGLWLSIPQTDDNPVNPVTIARLANIPHGTSFVAQGSFFTIADRPVIQKASITPFVIGNPANLIPFPESDLSKATQFRTPLADIPNVVQSMVDDPNSLLSRDIQNKNITSTTVLNISTVPLNPPNSGGGANNISFLVGDINKGPNAHSVQIDAIFWIETILENDGSITTQLQYTQRVLLNFNGLSWPHISVATLKKKS